MRKILGVACILAITLVIGCKENEPKLEGAFGIKFGANIQEVIKQIEENGDVYALEFGFNTDYVPEPNPHFSNYTIFVDKVSNKKIDMILANSNDVIDDKAGTELFDKLEAELIKKYGGPVERFDETQLKKYSDDSEYIEILKGTKWKVGIDEIYLSFEGYKKTSEVKYLSIIYHSNNTQQEIKKTIDSQGL